MNARRLRINTLQQGTVLNYRNNTWSFYDLPNVSSGATANVNSVFLTLQPLH